MADENRDPSGDTRAFRAFVQRGEPEAPAGRSRLPYVAAGVVALAVLVALLIIWLV